ncbi:MAG: hypothetical protein RXN50_00650 [Sulfolobaceae archaeon]|nr:DNA replication complex GINS family protein [Sulfolobales archaeon]MCQ4343574.1 DNA replication complex GINS family protein [Sulfolobales archaeon]
MKVDEISKALSYAGKVRVMVLESWGPFDSGFETITLMKGSEDEIPFWLAIELEKKGIVKTLNLAGIEDLSRVVFQEREKSNVPGSLIKLSRDFYVKSKYNTEKLSLSDRFEDMETKKKSELLLSEIKKLRLRKILNLALLGVEDPKILDNLTYEELLGFFKIRELLETLG